jgi:hypothetical protein
MQSEIPTQNSSWSVLASRFQSELELQKSRIWRLSGFRREYGGAADGYRDRELELKNLIDVLTGLSVQAVFCELADRQSANSSSRGPGRPKDVITPYLARELLSLFLRCHDRAGRQSVATSVAGKITQREDGKLFKFIEAVIRPLNQYLTTELGRRPLSGARLARYALDDRRPMAQTPKQNEAKPSPKEAAVAIKRQLPLGVIALQRALALPE